VSFNTAEMKSVLYEAFYGSTFNKTREKTLTLYKETSNKNQRVIKRVKLKIVRAFLFD